MKLRHALILALLSGALASAYLGYDLNQRLTQAAVALDAEADVPTIVGGAQALLVIGTPYLIALLAVAVANLTALLLLVAAFREERASALMRVQESGMVPAPPKPAGEAARVAEGGEETAPTREPLPQDFTWGKLEPWSTQHAGLLYEVWSRHSSSFVHSDPRDREAFDKFLGAVEFDAESSAVALNKEGALIGAVLAQRQPQFEDDAYWWLETPGVVAALLVEPGFRRKGVGRALLRFFEAAARHRRRPRLFVGGLENFPHLVPGVPDQDHGARMFFTAHGYREVRRTCHMEADYADYNPPRELVEREGRLKEQGYTFAPAEPADAEPFKAFLDEGNLDRKARRAEKFAADSDRFFLVRKDGKIVGFIQVSALDETGRSGIHLIYFLREHRGVGLGSVMLVKAHELWKRMGAKGGSIWTYPEAAQRFYPRAGFKTVQEWICYEKDLEHSWGDTQFVRRFR